MAGAVAGSLRVRRRSLGVCVCVSLGRFSVANPRASPTVGTRLWNGAQRNAGAFALLPHPHPPPHTPLSPPFPNSPSLKETGKNWLLMSVSVLLLLLLLLLLVLLLDSSV